MKTSLIIEDRLVRAARQEAQRTGKTISELISHWARVGYDTIRKTARRPRELKAVDLGGPAKMDLTSRRDWMDSLDQ